MDWPPDRGRGSAQSRPPRRPRLAAAGTGSPCWPEEVRGTTHPMLQRGVAMRLRTACVRPALAVPRLGAARAFSSAVFPRGVSRMPLRAWPRGPIEPCTPSRLRIYHVPHGVNLGEGAGAMPAPRRQAQCTAFSPWCTLWLDGVVRPTTRTSVRTDGTIRARARLRRRARQGSARQLRGCSWAGAGENSSVSNLAAKSLVRGFCVRHPPCTRCVQCECCARTYLSDICSASRRCCIGRLWLGLSLLLPAT